jgi:hypothetical protein
MRKAIGALGDGIGLHDTGRLLHVGAAVAVTDRGQARVRWETNS